MMRFKNDILTLSYMEIDIWNVLLPEPKDTLHKKMSVCRNCKRRIKHGRKYCNQKCRGEHQRGERSAAWKGGKTFAPYCWRFNNDLKKRVRAFFNYKCFLCGCDEKPNDKLRTHHIKYNKMACCDNGGLPLFVPLCASCHNKTSPKKRRDYWENYFYVRLMNETKGKCYFTKKEMRKIEREPLC